MERLGYVQKSASPMMTLQRILGFRNTRTLLLWILFGSAVTHFALARISGIDVDGVLCAQRGRSVPGECFFWQGEEMLAKASMVLHIGTILPASVLAMLQFVPYLRRRALRFHRVNGYLTLLLSGLGVFSGLVITRNAFGGTLELQSAMILSSIMFLTCLCLAVYYVKRLDIEKHRAWMLRAWAVVSCKNHLRDVRVLARYDPGLSRHHDALSQYTHPHTPPRHPQQTLHRPILRRRRPHVRKQRNDSRSSVPSMRGVLLRRGNGDIRDD